MILGAAAEPAIRSNYFDTFVAGIGAGGTLMGVAEALKAVRPEVKIVAVEPIGSRSEATKKVTEHLS